MLKITIACVGRVKEKYLADGIGEYAKRLRRYCKLSWYEVADEKTVEGASAVQEEEIRRKEGERLRKGIPEGAYVITLEIGGKPLTSVEFAEKIGKLETSGVSHIVFVIGGSIGLSEEVRARSDFRLSFSAMTFPHQLMRMILTEQIYRAFRILHNEPYHK